MVNVVFEESFRRIFSKIKDQSLKDKIIKQLIKIRENPEIGKPMMYERKGTREVYIHPYRMIYCFSKEKEKLLIIDFYHKDEQ